MNGQTNIARLSRDPSVRRVVPDWFAKEHPKFDDTGIHGPEFVESAPVSKERLTDSRPWLQGVSRSLNVSDHCDLLMR